MKISIKTKVILCLIILVIFIAIFNLWGNYLLKNQFLGTIAPYIFILTFSFAGFSGLIGSLRREFYFSIEYEPIDKYRGKSAIILGILVTLISFSLTIILIISSIDRISPVNLLVFLGTSFLLAMLSQNKLAKKN